MDNINVSVRNCEISQDTKEYTQDKVSKINKYRPRKIDVIMEYEGTRDASEHCRIELIVAPERGNPIVATARAGEWLGAVDQAVDKVERQLRKMKDKITSHRVRKFTPQPPSDDDDILRHY